MSTGMVPSFQSHAVNGPKPWKPEWSHASVQQPRFASLSRPQRVGSSFAGALLVFLAGGMLDWLVRYELLPQVSLMLAGIAVALIVGLLLFKILSDAHDRHQAVRERLSMIADLNHHIRNALQIIAYHNVSAPGRSEHAVLQVTAAVTRIESVLKEILPGRSH